MRRHQACGSTLRLSCGAVIPALVALACLLCAATSFADSGRRLALGAQHSCVITAAGGVKCWGHNDDGQLGNGAIRDEQEVPTQVVGLTSGVVDIAAGGLHTCAVTSTGAVKCWGFCGSGQTGTATCPAGGLTHLTPADVVGLSSGVSSVAAGRSHTCALLSNDTVKCWGSNASGQVGDGSILQRSTPVDVAGLSDVSDIAAGWDHTCAVTYGGAVFCWGENAHGELGDGSTITRLAPVPVSGLGSGASQVTAGAHHTCAVMADSSMTCWGSNTSGELGDSTITSRPTPANVTYLGAGKVRNAAAGDSHTCALLNAGGALCWGANASGQVGIGSTTNTIAMPFGVDGLAYLPVRDISAGSAHTCASLERGEVRCWGNNGLGQIGDNTFGIGNNRLSPIAVVGFRMAPTDVDRDGRSDSAVWRSSTGTWFVRHSATNGTSYTSDQWGDITLGDVPVPGDYDGDMQMEFAVWRSTTGMWYWRVDAADDGYGSRQWGSGAAGDIPVAADYDGDGKTDLAVWRPATGTWYIKNSRTNYTTYVTYNWGSGPVGDVAVPADFDGDGKTDPAVFRPSTGTWYILRSGNGYSPAGCLTFQWGVSSDKLVAADYDGDGKTDPAVWRGSSGTWYALLSRSNYSTYLIHTWGSGASGDVPVAGDYDSDLKADLAVWRPWAGTWYLLDSGTEYAEARYRSWNWGLSSATDNPVTMK